MATKRMSIAGSELEVFDSGAGTPLLFLHSVQGFEPDHRYVAALSRTRRLIAPSHPGFGHSALPDWLDAVDDISYIYLELLDRLGLQQVDLVGCSIGGWIACELAAKAPERVRRLVLAAPMGVKTGPVDRLDLPDIFAMPQERLDQLLYHDASKYRMDPATLSDDALALRMRNRETLALLTWEPYMHNPKLKHRLHRVDAPVLFLRGESDGLVSAAYMDSFSRLLPRARCETIPAAGHSAHIEQPDAFAARVLSFLESRIPLAGILNSTGGKS